MEDGYLDIIDLPHHESRKHKKMPRAERAAQFAPFAALTGYDDLIAESERTTEQRTELDEDMKERLNAILTEILALPQDKRPETEITYFREDGRKEGGRYEKTAGRIVSFDSLASSIALESGDVIFVGDIYEIQADGME